MVVKIVTDSTSDISPEIANALDITVVPVYVGFGDEVYRDGVDISNDEFYQKLATLLVHPATSQPTPEDFAKVYSDCSKEADGIISIHISDKVSGAYNAALQSKKMTKEECQIEVVDSYVTSVGLALIVMAAAKLASAGGGLLDVFEERRRVISRVYITGLVNTMKYLLLGGRLDKVTAVMASILDIKPLLAFRDGDIVRAGLVHIYQQWIDRLRKFVESYSDIQDLAIAYSTEPEQANQLKTRLGSTFRDNDIYITQLGAGLGVHVDPGGLIVALRRE